MIKILVLGSTGPTGLQIVEQALRKNYNVTAFVRDPDKMKFQHEKLELFQGDALKREDVEKAVEGKDAVVCALGVGKSLKSNNLMSNAVEVLIPAMEKKGVNRLVFLSAMGVGETIRDASIIQKLAFGIFLRDIYKDKAKADQKIKASNLHWTIVGPVVLTNGRHTGKYVSGEHLKMKGMPSISRADVADFMLHQIYDNTYLQRIVELKQDGKIQ